MRFVLPAGLAPPEPPLELGLMLEPPPEDPGGGWWLEADERGGFSWTTPQLGAHRATLFLMRMIEQDYDERVLGEPHAVEARAQPAEQTIELELTPAALEAAVRELGG